MAPALVPDCSTTWLAQARNVPGGRSRILRSAAATLSCCACVWVGGGVAQGATGLPDPCRAIPSVDLNVALGLKQPPVSALASVPNVETCTFAKGRLSVSVGSTAIAYPARPLKVIPVPGLPDGTYRTFAGSTQTEIIFFKGGSTAGIYGVVRNFASIKQRLLERIAKALFAAVGQGSGRQTTPSGQLVGENG